MNQEQLHTNKPFFMKINKAVVGFLIISAAFTACKKDEVQVESPTIKGLEIGLNNSKTAYPGGDVHFEAELIAPANIASVKLTIDPQSGSGWNVDKAFTTGFVGLKNANFHEHIKVPANAAIGIYQVKLIVTDQQGQITEVKAELILKKDLTLPTVSGYEVAINAAGNDLHFEALITAPNKIAKVILEVHGNSFEKEFEFSAATMVGQTTYNIHQHVNVAAAPAGHYHVHLKVIDQSGKENEFEEHFDKL